MEKTVAIILAAGKGKRMKSDLPKVLHKVLFKPMIDWVADAAFEAGAAGVLAVVGHGSDTVVSHLKEAFPKCETATQKEQLGTGHAVMQAVPYIKKESPENVLVLSGDAPFIDSGIISAFYDEHMKSGNDLTVMSAVTENPFGYGRIMRDGSGNVTGIIEEKDASDEQRTIKEINAGVYLFKTAALLDALSALKNDNAQGEYYLTDTVAAIGAKGLRGGSFSVEMERIAGANDRRQLMELNSIGRRIILAKLYDAGVTVVDESGVNIGPDVKIGHDTVILPGTIITGKTVIGTGCTIGPNSLIENCTFGNNIVFNASQAHRSMVDDGVTIGPFSQLRPDCHLKENVHVGDFVEVKNSTIGVGTKVAHLTYVGDSDVGGGVNFGCGVVTVNYDGVKKCRTTIGDGAFIGCNTNLVAPVKVGNNAYTAAGSTITKDIPDGALAVARSRQGNIDGWAQKKLSQKKKK